MKLDKKAKISVAVLLLVILICAIVGLGFVISKDIFNNGLGSGGNSGNGHDYNGIYDELEKGDKAMSIKAEYIGGTLYAGGQICKDNIVVTATYKNGREKVVDNYECDMLQPDYRLAEGSNTLIVKYDDVSATLTVDAIDVNTLAYPPSYILHKVDKQAAEEKVNQISNGSLSYPDAYAVVAFTGDSQIKALATNGIFLMDRIIAEVGESLDYFESNLDGVVRMASDRKVLIVHYGINSLTTSSKDREQKIQRYKELLTKIKSEAPEVRIIVSGLFPVSNTIPNNKPQYAYITEYDFMVFKMCQELGIEYLSDNEYMVNHQEVFGNDGLHETKKFYTDYWLKNLIITMGL